MQLSLRRPRFTVRWLMVAVAIVGLMFAADDWKRRREAYLEDLREQHWVQVRHWGAEQSDGKEKSSYHEEDSRWEWMDYARMARDLRDYHEKLAHKYEQAALQAWFPAWPDLPAPPEPKRPPVTVIIHCD
jgi:hypothetical protein